MIWIAVCPAADSGLLHLKINDKLAGFRLPEISSGGKVTFTPASGKPSVLMFFSVSPSFRARRSINLAGILAQSAKKFNKRVNILGIYSGAKNADLVRYIKDGLITIPVLNDSKKVVYKKYGVFMLPIAIIADASGRLQSVIPYTANISEVIDNNLKFLLGDWTLKQFRSSLKTPANLSKTKEEKAYIRRVNYGRVMSARHMYAAAIREFNTAHKIMPQSIEAMIGIGQVQLELKKWKKAAASFSEALKINNESDKAMAGLGLALYRSGDEKRALPILENALISKDQDLEVLISLGAIYEKNGNLAKAIRLNKLAISLLQKRFK